MNKRYHPPTMHKRFFNSPNMPVEPIESLHNIITSNTWIQSMIFEWWIEQGIPLFALKNKDEGLIIKDERNTLNELLDQLGVCLVCNQNHNWNRLE